MADTFVHLWAWLTGLPIFNELWKRIIAAAIAFIVFFALAIGNGLGKNIADDVYRWFKGMRKTKQTQEAVFEPMPFIVPGMQEAIVYEEHPSKEVDGDFLMGTYTQRQCAWVKELRCSDKLEEGWEYFHDPRDLRRVWRRPNPVARPHEKEFGMLRPVT